MTTATASIETLADLLERLGHIPPERIRFHPPPGTATESDVLIAQEAPRKRLCELIDGVLVEKAMGYEESVLAIFLAEMLNAYVRPRNLGLVSGADGPLRLWAGRVRIPDVAFVSWDRFPQRRKSGQPIPDLAPNLAVEILSASNTAAEMERKRQDYFAAGVEIVWEIDPETRSATVWAAADARTVLSENESLDGGSVLPGFALALKDLFTELDRQG